MTVNPPSLQAGDPTIRRAGIVTRFAAAASDFGIVLALGGLTYLGVSGARFIISPARFSWPELPFLLIIGLEGVLAIAYLTAGWAISGRTFGKSLHGPSGGEHARAVARLDASVPARRVLCLLSRRLVLGAARAQSPIAAGHPAADDGDLRLDQIREHTRESVISRRPAEPARSDIRPPARPSSMRRSGCPRRIPRWWPST